MSPNTRAAMMLAGLFISIGALTMSDTNTAIAEEPKKEEPKELKISGITYRDRASIRQWDAQGKKFLNPVQVWLARREGKDVNRNPVTYFLVHGPADNAMPLPGSLITDKDGNEYEVQKGEEHGFDAPFRVKQTKTAEAKKP